jgi:hypothetical protein
MPNSVVKSFAKRANKSESEVEKLWKETEEEVKDKFKFKTSAYWAYVNKTVQHKLGLAKESLSFRNFCSIITEEEKKQKFVIGQIVKLCKKLKGIPDDIAPTIGETFSVIDVDDKTGDIKISNSFGPEFQDTYFKKENFTTIEESNTK